MCVIKNFLKLEIISETEVCKTASWMTFSESKLFKAENYVL